VRFWFEAYEQGERIPLIPIDDRFTESRTMQFWSKEYLATHGFEDTSDISSILAEP
jgi:hypothetical protein